MPLQATSGAASYDAFGGGAAAVPQYIEDVFSTYLYTGTGSPFTLTNGIDLSGKGGMVWTKDRTRTGTPGIIDTVRGNRSAIYPNLTGAQDTAPDDTYGITGFNSTGYGVGINYSFNINDISFGITNYVSWTFRKQPKFFDVVTYTGDGNIGRTVSHSLNATVGFMLIKCTSQPGGWVAYHRSIGASQFLTLNATDAAGSGSGGNTPAKYWNSTAPTSTVFSLGDAANTNETGQTYVAYLFAHDAGGFGESDCCYYSFLTAPDYGFTSPSGVAGAPVGSVAWPGGWTNPSAGYYEYIEEGGSTVLIRGTITRTITPIWFAEDCDCANPLP